MTNQIVDCRRLENLEWLGGHPALDFVNTVHSWVPEETEDYLHSFDDLVRWHEIAGLLSTSDARQLRTQGACGENAAYRQSLEFRSHLYKLLTAVARGDALPADSLTQLEKRARDTVEWRQLVAKDRGLCWTWNLSDAPPEAVLGPIAWAATDLLESGPIDRIKVCPAPQGCGWVFLDQSRNRSRHWCSMKNCGNLAKVRRYRLRHQ